jgi:hypothetical protein
MPAAPTSATSSKGRYAAGTTVDEYRSLKEIKDTLTRFGASAFGHAQEGSRVLVTFEAKSASGKTTLRVRFRLSLPEVEDFRHVRNGASGMRKRPDTECREKWQQECRRRWRSLANGIKSKLAMVEDDIETLEQAFWAHVVLPNGQTLYEASLPAVEEGYRTGRMPELMPGLTPAGELPPLEGVIMLPAPKD